MELGTFTLTPWQEAGVIHLEELKHAVLSFRPGKGKTFPAIYAAKEQCGDTKECLVISQKRIIEKMWKEDIVPLGILPKRTTFINTELMNVNDEVFKQLLKRKWECIIVDECHLLKNPTSVQSKRVHKLCKDVPMVIGLSGTPRCNSDEDLFGIMRSLHIGRWGDITKTEFERDWGVRVLKQFGGHSFYKFEGIQPYLKNVWDAGIQKYFLMADYEEGEMPPLNIHNDESDGTILPFEKSDIYNKALQGIIHLPESSTTFQKAVAIQKAQQAANGFLYLEDGSTYKVPNFVNKKLDFIKNLLEKKKGTPIIIGYRFTEDKNQIIQAFPGMVTEDTEAFKTGKKDILLLQCQQGIGVNLQRAKAIIYYTMDVSYANYEQMIHRAWRTGQPDPVDIYILTYKGSVEEKIWKSVKEKKAIGDLLYSIKGELY